MNEVFNALVDTVISGVSGCVKTSGQNVMPVPDMNETFQMMLMEGGMKATEGTLEDLSSLRRVDDVQVKVDFFAGTAELKVKLTLDVLKVLYKQCKAWLGAMKMSDVLTVVVTKNLISLQMSVNTNQGFKPAVDHVKVKELSGIEVTYKGGSKLLSPIAQAVANNMHKEIEAVIEMTLNDIIEEQMTRFQSEFSSTFSTFQGKSK